MAHLSNDISKNVFFNLICRWMRVTATVTATETPKGFLLVCPSFAANQGCRLELSEMCPSSVRSSLTAMMVTGLPATLGLLLHTPG